MLGELEGSGLAGRVLVVDDGSPDGTGELAEELSAAEPQVEVLHRRENAGLGPGHQAGFRRALDVGAEVVSRWICERARVQDRAGRFHVVAAVASDLVRLPCP